MILYPAIRPLVNNWNEADGPNPFEDLYRSYVVDENDKIVAGPLGRATTKDAALKRATDEAELLYWVKTRPEASKHPRGTISP